MGTRFWGERESQNGFEAKRGRCAAVRSASSTARGSGREALTSHRATPAHGWPPGEAARHRYHE